MKRTISAEVGKGSVNHNSRKFRAENVDGSRTYRNIDYCNERIQTVYHQLFDEALKRYNEKQTRADRRISNYYEKIRSGNQEKPFHEIILQIGNREDMSAADEYATMRHRRVCGAGSDGTGRVLSGLSGAQSQPLGVFGASPYGRGNTSSAH